MERSNQYFDEIQVYEGIAERTGVTVDRKTLRGSRNVCRSVAELTRKSRSSGDGVFYLAGAVWPENETRIDLTLSWTPFA
jgi:hypothetical protein